MVAVVVISVVVFVKKIVIKIVDQNNPSPKTLGRKVFDPKKI